MFKQQRSLISGLFICSLLALGSCKSKFEKLKASNDNAKKYQEAMKYYNKKEYSKALDLFDGLTQRYRGQTEAEDLFYYNAYTNYKLKDYTSARYHFKTFADTYPNSARAEECRFMSAYCYYLDSPIFSLDQENTLKAIETLQLFINLYPKSERVAEASKLIQNLRDKLEQKAYTNAKLYLTIGDYQSAVIAFGNVLRDYPDTKYAEEMEFLSIRAQYKYSKNSTDFRQEERFGQVLSMYDQYAEKYPQSKYLHEALGIKQDAEYGIKHAKAQIAEATTNPKLAKKLASKDTTKTQPPSEKGQGNQKMP
ncbi:outer membrane protein assembly factor BamD [Mucilaginibacter agri]|uniref:Outer membrane protein assembly factor BamD n=1 Tax=Mucilaginibacter agri TaxID=2695265 RepID=A0A966DSN0_9SPHI|nr:outer membrane protein assembly factor BamD [Mucilaginibacter agri]NCD67944.1 outer membrane protein assembly factor BamD [Mucilaginibacter agri]